MKHLIFLTLLGSLLVNTAAQAQSFACSTPTPKEAPRFPVSKVENLQANPYVVNVFIHILRNDDGSNAAMSDAVLQTNLDRMAAFFRPHNICFTFVGRGFIDNTDWNTNYLTSQIGDLHAVNPHSDAIDMYIHRNGFEGSGGSAYDIPSAKCSVAASASFNFEHEMGHCLGLFHTFEAAFGTECADGTNCGSAGDIICDTNADFPNSQDFGSGCGFTGTQTIDCNGGTFNYSPLTTNIMSYWAACYSNFSGNQGTRMRNTIDATGFLQARLTPDTRVIAAQNFTQEIALGAQNLILMGNIAALGDVIMQGNAHGIFSAGSKIQAVAGTRISPTGNNGVLLTVNTLCDGLFLKSSIPNVDRAVGSQQASRSDATFVVFPNPVQDRLSIQASLEKPGPATLQLFDVTGRVARSQVTFLSDDSGQIATEMEMNGLAPGIYLLRLWWADGQKTIRLSKVD